MAKAVVYTNRDALGSWPEVVAHFCSEGRIGGEHQDEGNFQKWLKRAHGWKPGRTVILPIFALNLMCSTAKWTEVRPSCNLSKKVGHESFSRIDNARSVLAQEVVISDKISRAVLSTNFKRVDHMKQKGAVYSGERSPSLGGAVTDVEWSMR